MYMIQQEHTPVPLTRCWICVLVMESFTSEVGSCAVWVQSDSYLLVCYVEGTHQSVAHGTTQIRRMLCRNTLHLNTLLFTIIKTGLQRLERWLSGFEHLLLLERT